MPRKHLNPKSLFEPRGYTHTVAVSGPVKLVTISGQVAFDRKGNVVGKGDMRAQAEQVFRNLAYNLQAAGARWSDVIKANVYVVDLTPESLAAYRAVRVKFFDAKTPPASTLVGVTKLVHQDLLLEVEVIAAVGATAAARAGTGGRAGRHLATPLRRATRAGTGTPVRTPTPLRAPAAAAATEPARSTKPASTSKPARRR